jgi:hypothetical protein
MSNTGLPIMGLGIGCYVSDVGASLTNWKSKWYEAAIALLQQSILYYDMLI